MTHADFTTFIMKCLTPATFLANSLWGYILIVTLGNLLWLIGVNGSNVIFPIVCRNETEFLSRRHTVQYQRPELMGPVLSATIGTNTAGK